MKNFLLFLMISAGTLLSAQQIDLSLFASGFTSPVEIATADDNRLFVVQQNGVIKIAQPNGTVNPAPFLDLSPKITFGGERGLLGLAFHPQYTTNGYFYVYYNNLAGNIELARYTVSAGNPQTADPASAKILLNITKNFANHNGGSIHFAPDGMLWISTGDGGGGGDPNNNAQNKNSLLGKILRIDVNTAGTYLIPPDNPFVSVPGADEIWSYGLRNAWKFSFDTVSGNVLIADVGQGQIEEINRKPITQAGLNYGWRCYEGNNPYNTAGCEPASTMTFPLATYDHSGGKCSITGGYVYRGSAYPAFSGKYFFADYCSGQIGLLHADNSITWSTPFSGQNFSTFGRDAANELYVASLSTGSVYKISTTSLATENIDAKKIRIYPNPAGAKIFVKGLGSGDCSLDIHSADGRLFTSGRPAEDGSFDISKLSSGVYFVTVRSNGTRIYSEKLLVK